MNPRKRILVAAILAGSSPLFAATVIKSGSGTDLTAGASWTGGNAPGTGDVAAWNSTSLVSGLTVGPSDVTWSTMVFGSGSALSGNLDISGTGKINLSAGAAGGAGSIDVLNMVNSGQTTNVTIGNDLVIAYTLTTPLTPPVTGTANTTTRAQLVALGQVNPQPQPTGILTLNGAVTANGGASANDTSLWLRGNATGSQGIINGVLTVDGQLAKGDTGTWTLNNANTIGWTFINNGTLRAGNDQAFGAGTIYIGTGGTGTITIAAASAIARTYANPVSILNAVTFGQGATAAQTFNGPIDLGASAARTITANQTTTFSGVISSGAGSGLTKSGGSDMTLSGASANTYTGTTTVTNGNLFLAKNAGVNAVPGNISVTGGTLMWTNADQVPDTASITVSGGGGINGKVIDTFASVSSSATNAGKINFGSASNVVITGAMTISGNNGATTYNNYSLAANAAGSSTLTVGSLSLDNAFYGIGQGGANNATLTLNGDYTGANTSTIAVFATGGAGQNRLSLSAGPHNFSVTGTTTVNAAVTGSGSLTKQGNGTLILNTMVGSGTGAVTNYSGLTTVAGGTLEIDSVHAGTGGILVTAGTLSGIGTLSSVVNVGDDTGTLDSLITGGTVTTVGTLTMSDLLGIKADAGYSFQLDSLAGLADKLVSNGISLSGTSTFSFSDIAATSTALTEGTTFTIIDNISANPIDGTFAATPEGSLVTIGVNTFQVSYAGGTGNDMTLTSVASVPEPGTALSLLGGMALLVGLRRRR